MDAVADTMSAEMNDLKKLCDRILDLETDVLAKTSLMRAFETIITASHDLNTTLRIPIVGVKVAVSGSPEGQKQKLELFNDFMLRVINMGMKALTGMLLIENDQWSKILPAMQRLHVRVQDNVASGMTTFDAVTKAVADTDEIPESAKEHIREKLQEHAAELDKRTTRIVPDNLGAIIPELLGKELSLIWRNPTATDTVDSSSFGDAALQRGATPTGKPDKTFTDVFLELNETASYKLIAVKLNDVAREVFLASRMHIPMFVLSVNRDMDGKDREGVAVFDATKGMVSDDSKEMVSELVRAMVAKFDSDLVITVTEAWVRKLDPKAVVPEDMTIRPAEAKDRIEALVLTLCAKDGSSVVIVNRIIRDTDSDTVSMGDAEIAETRDESATKLPGRFSDWWD